MSSNSFTMVELHLGQLAAEDQTFCPYSAVAKYPFRYFRGDSEERQQIAKECWDGGQFKNHGWNIYYIRTHNDANPTPLLLIPKTEVQNFFQEVKEKTGIHLPFPDDARNPGFEVVFQTKGEPRPRFLARLTSEMTILDLKGRVPAEGTTEEEPLKFDHESLPAFRKRMELAYLAGKNDTQAQRDKKKQGRLVQKGRWIAQLRRTQCYLGLRPQQDQNAPKFDPMVVLPPVDINKPVPYLFNLNIIFICIDIEAYERDSKKLTEIGISTLDTLDIIKTPLGQDGVEWSKLIRSRHFRVAEYGHLVNSRFVQGCPDDFRKEFGTSEWISVNEISRVVAACFREPYSTPGQYTARPMRRRDCPAYGSNIESSIYTENTLKRNVILVGHDIKSDITYLRSIGYNVANIGNIVESVDTIDLWRAWKHESQSLKLSRILYELEVDAYHLHNAGNDAAYTLQALLGITIGALDPTRKAPATIPVDRSETAALDDTERRMEEEAEWADVEGEIGDGGKALSISDMEFDMRVSKDAKTKDRASKASTAPGNAQAHSSGPSNYTKANPAHQQQGKIENTKAKAKPAPKQEELMVIYDDEEYGM